MGELHLDIIRDRIWKEYKVEAELGPLQVAYKETSQTACTHTLDINKTIGTYFSFHFSTLSSI